MSTVRDRIFRQATLARDVSISGTGIHTGNTLHLRLLPAAADTGIVFRRVDCRGIEIPARASAVSSVELATTLGRDDVTISTVEHLLAALRIAGVDNSVVEIDGPEVPILDGSALPWLRLLEAAGRRQQDARRRILAVTAPLSVEQGERRIRLAPYPGQRVSYRIDFPIPAIGTQSLELEIDPAGFERELAPARTFAMASDVAHLHRRGLGLGGAQDNCVVFADDGPVNTQLRFADEPVRHKALDAIGDLSLVGAPLWAHIEVERGGHQLHFAMVEELLSRPDCFSWVDDEERPLAARQRRRRAGRREELAVV